MNCWRKRARRPVKGSPARFAVDWSWWPRRAGDAFAAQQACLPLVVLAELLSDPVLPPAVASLLKELPRLELSDGYWERTGSLRAKVLARGQKARLADALIAQSCLDHNVALVTADRDFRNFVRHGQI